MLNNSYAKYLLLIVCAFAICEVKAQQCEYLYLESIYEKLPTEIKDNKGGSLSGFTVEVGCNSQGIVSQLGVNIPIFDGDSTLISSFVERYFLDLILAKTDQDIENVLDRSKSKLFYNNAEYQIGPYWKLSEGLPLLNSSVSFNMRRDSLEYRLVWKDEANNSLGLDFPANVQILTGKDKTELENSIEDLFSQSSVITNPITIPVADSLYAQIKGKLYEIKGESFIVDSMSNTTYYTRKKAKQYEPVYTPDMLAMSLVNLLLLESEYGDQTAIRISQSLYGNQTKSFDITTNTLRDFCLINGLDTYVGVEKNEEKLTEVTVILHNRELNYVHLLHIAANVDSIFGSGEKYMDARLYSYIPADNISNIFGEYKETKEKIKL